MKNYLKRTTTFILALLMLLSVPLQAFAEIDHDKIADYKYSYINKIDHVKPAKPEDGKTAEDLIKNPDQPAIYTLRTDFKVQRGEKYEVDYQPYIASVGAAASDTEKNKVNKTMDLPALAGYDKPQDKFTIDYKTVFDAANGKNATGNDANGIRYSANQEFDYKAKSNSIKVKHVFQDLEDFTKYTNPDGSTDEERARYNIQRGNTGSTMQVKPLDDNEIKGFIPEAEYINMQVPENAEDFILEYRYNRAHYDVIFDTAGGTPLPNRTLYYEQEIPKIADADIPTKVGGIFQGWKPSVDLKSKDGTKTFNAGDIIKDGKDEPILNLDADLKMPASKVTFTAVWKDKEKADYAIQFWAEKADHADDASLLEKYDYMGAKVYKDQDTGTRPNLDTVSIDKIPFPDLDQTRLEKIWAKERFYRDQLLYLNKFYVYNKDLTHEQNKDPQNVNLVKSVDATGKTIYNIYYDRQVYDLYFTKSNAREEEKTFYPEIYKPDGKGKAVKVGEPGNPYHFKARFNQLMLDWPNDGMQIKGFTSGNNSHGWSPNMQVPWWDYRDTPPYRLSADQFLDFPEYENKGGYTKRIDAGAGRIIEVKDFKTLSFGIEEYNDSIPHHMDFWMDGFKPGETIIRYDLYRSKADTSSLSYGHKYTVVKGFTPYGFTGTDFNQYPTVKTTMVDEDVIDDLNDERAEITPFPDKEYWDVYNFKHKVGELFFIRAFFNDADQYGDPDPNIEGAKGYEKNGYLRYKYTRNKYPLRFNYDPTKIKGDNEFNSTNQLDTFYEFPLKALSPDLVDDSTPQADREYFKDNPANLLDNPENLKKLGLTDLVFTDTDGKLKVKRPDGLSDQMVFKGWALDPAGTKLIWENKDEKMPNHALNLYAKWGEPDYKWKVTFDPDGGKLNPIDEKTLTKERKTIQEGDIGQEETNTYAKKEENEGNNQVFTVIQRQKLVEPKNKPTKKGYDFMGWEVIRYKKNAKGDYTNEIDTSYRDTYKVPELYSFGNDVVAPVYLKAIWVPNEKVDVKIEHYFLDKEYNLDKSVIQNPEPDKLVEKRAGYLVATTGDRQNEKYILAPHSELEDHKETSDVYNIYKEYNDRVKLNNSFFQTIRVEPEKIDDGNGNLIDNPKAENNVFKFFYRPFRQREYKVNYIDERAKAAIEAETDPVKKAELIKNNSIISPEAVTNGNRHYDARNYRPIPGWKLVGDPQQQLFFDVNEETNEFLGINGTGSDEITFYYKDVRVIEVPGNQDPPEGYVRVTFKADKGGAFTDKDGNSKTELHYDVIKGLKSDLLPEPKELEEGKEKEEGKYYITPDNGKKFIKWDEKPLLNKNTLIENTEKDFYVFTAKFEWSGLSASGLVRTEAFKDPNNKWTNDFAPKIEDLKKQLVWKEKDQVKDLPAGTEIKLFDEAGNELTKDDQVYELVNEKKAADKDELVRTVNVKAKVTFKDGKDPQELNIPITVYKNVYEALNEKGDKPLFLKEAEGKEAKDGGLKDVTGNYVKVTVQPTEKNTNKDAKVYYVNPKAWVNIPEVTWSQDDKDKTDFLKWTADKVAQNEGQAENGIFDFTKRHKFTDEETLIKPLFTNDVVEQKEGEDKPKVPNNFVKVIVKTTDKATDATAFEKTFWVNPTKELTIPVTDPVGKENQKFTFDGLGEKDVNYIFKEWQKVQTGESDDNLTDVTPATKIDLAKNQYTDKVTVIEAVYKKSIQAEPIVEPLKTKKLDTPQGKEITDEILKGLITPQKGKEIDSIEVISKPDGNTVGNEPAKVIVKYKDGTTQGTNDDPVVIPVEVHKNIIPEAPGGQRPKDALDNYVKVIFKAGTGGTVSGDLVYYVSPEVEVDMTESAGKITKTPSVGYFVNGEKWTNTDEKTLKGTFTDAETEFVFNFDKSKNIVEKIDENTKKPDGYVTIIFKTDGNGKVNGKDLIIYYVNPNADITLKVLDKNETATDKQLAVPTTTANSNYVFDKWQEAIDEGTPITNDRTHVAIFVSGQVTLTYQAGEGATGNVPTKTTVNVGATVVLAGPGNLAKENSTFLGWKLDEDEKIYQPGDQVTLEKSRTATAQWKSSAYTVSFNSMGGSDVPSQEVEHGKTATEPKSPTLDGKVFMGWKEKETDTSYFDFNTPITADKTLIAIWQDPVQKINDGDTVDEQFIKVTFLKGAHGTLKEGQVEDIEKVTYKVAKDLTFDKAQQAGLEVPEIAPAKYYKAKTENSGWDKALDLTLEANETEKIFIAQYEPKADVIPVEPGKTDTQTEEEKPEGMVLVTFKVSDDNKFYLVGNAKYYVKKETEVRIPTPVVLEKNIDDVFKGWQAVNIVNELLDPNTTDPNATKIQLVKQSFSEDTVISDQGVTELKLVIDIPRPGEKIVYIKELSNGATGKLEVISGSESKTYDNTTYKRRGKTSNVFKLDSSVQSGDILKYWAEDGSRRSLPREDSVE